MQILEVIHCFVEWKMLYLKWCWRLRFRSCGSYAIRLIFLVFCSFLGGQLVYLKCFIIIMLHWIEAHVVFKGKSILPPCIFLFAWLFDLLVFYL